MRDRITELDGLRCIAVLMVVIGHAFSKSENDYLVVVEFLGRAATGVTLFFVLSGYLITSIFVKSREHFSFSGFYFKRILRLWPALYVYIGFLWVMKFTANAPVGSFEHLGLVSLHIWNYGLPMAVSLPEYYNAAGNFMHLWSLALEEQFYWMWPVVFFALLKSNINRISIFCIVAVVFMPFIRIITNFASPDYAPFVSKLFHTASDPIFVGCLLAMHSEKLSRINFLKSRHTPLISLILLISISFFGYNLFSSYYSLTVGPFLEASISAMLILSVRSTQTFLGVSLLNSAPIQMLGLSSYSIYLWQNIFTQNGALFKSDPLAGVLLSLGVGLLSYWLIERPVNALRSKVFFRSQV